MNKPLLGEKLAVLVASGFCENDLTAVQRVLQPLGVTMRIISVDNGLVSSWNGDGWGLNFAADSALNSALAADFSMLVVPGGQRSVDKLQLTAHTKRFIGGFIDSGKPVVAVGEALELLELCGAGHHDKGNLLTISLQDKGDEAYANTVSDFLISQYSLVEAA